MGLPVLAQAALTTTASEQDALGYAQALAQASSHVLGDAVAGVVLHGSLTLGDYLPGRSDVDLLVVVDDPLTPIQVASLAEATGQKRPRAPIRVDLRVVTLEVAAAPTPLPPMEAHLTIKGRKPIVHVDGCHPGERDLAIEFAVCRAHGRSILGAPPAELIGRVADEWVLDAGDVQLAAWQAIGDDPPYAQLTVLTACRVWRFAEERRHSSKDAAGEWALRHDPTLKVVRDALHQRHSEPTHPIGDAEIHELLTRVRGRVAETRGLAGPLLMGHADWPEKPPRGPERSRRRIRVQRLDRRRMNRHEWRLWEQLINERGIVIDRPRGTAHPLYPDMIYPYDYGHVPGTSAADGHEIDAFVGRAPAGLVGLIALVHQPTGTADPKLLVNLTREDADAIMAFLDRGDPEPELELIWRQAAG